MVRKSERNKPKGAKEKTPEKVVRKAGRHSRRKKKSSSESEPEQEVTVEDVKAVKESSERPATPEQPQKSNTPDQKSEPEASSSRPKRVTRRQVAESDSATKTPVVEKEWKEDEKFWTKDSEVTASSSEAKPKEDEGTLWKVQSANGSSGEIQKIKICRQRPADASESSPSPVKDSSPRRKRSGRTGQGESFSEGEHSNPAETEAPSSTVPDQSETATADSTQVRSGKQELARDKPEQSAPDQPEQSVPEQPEQSAPDQPEQSAPDQPEQSVPDQPEQSAPDQPEQSVPDQPEQSAPEQSAPDQPEQSAPDQPEQSVPDKPEQSAPDQPEQSTPDQPEQSTPDQPEQSAPDEPEQSRPEQSGQSAQKEAPCTEEMPTQSDVQVPVTKEKMPSDESEEKKDTQETPNSSDYISMEQEIHISRSSPEKEAPDSSTRRKMDGSSSDSSSDSTSDSDSSDSDRGGKRRRRRRRTHRHRRSSRSSGMDEAKPSDSFPEEEINSEKPRAPSETSKSPPPEKVAARKSPPASPVRSDGARAYEEHNEDYESDGQINMSEDNLTLNETDPAKELAKEKEKLAYKTMEKALERVKAKERQVQVESKKNEGHKQESKEDGEISPPVEKEVGKRRLLVINKPQEQPSTKPTKLIRTSESSAAQRKRRLTITKNKENTDSTVVISARSLKLIVPEAKPLLPDEVDLSIGELATKHRKIVHDIKPKDMEVRVKNDVREVMKKELHQDERRSIEEAEKESDSPPPSQLENHKVIRKISIVTDDAKKLTRSPSPAGKKATAVLFITNLVRPFTAPQLRELLARTGTISQNGFYIDKIKSKCYVKYTDVDMAVETRHALHGVRWPVNNPKTLKVEFATPEDMAVVQELAEDENKKSESVDSGWLNEQAALKPVRRVTAGVREWDVGKVSGTEGPTVSVKDEPTEGRKRVGDEEWNRNKERPTELENRRRAHSPEPKEFPSRKVKRRDNDAPSKLLDDLFRKTKTTPCIYWLPLTAAQIVVKEEMRRQHMAEHERRLAEIRKTEQSRRDRERERRKK